MSLSHSDDDRPQLSTIWQAPPAFERASVMASTTNPGLVDMRRALENQQSRITSMEGEVATLKHTNEVMQNKLKRIAEECDEVPPKKHASGNDSLVSLFRASLEKYIDRTYVFCVERRMTVGDARRMGVQFSDETRIIPQDHVKCVFSVGLHDLEYTPIYDFKYWFMNASNGREPFPYKQFEVLGDSFITATIISECEKRGAVFRESLYFYPFSGETDRAKFTAQNVLSKMSSKHGGDIENWITPKKTGFWTVKDCPLHAFFEPVIGFRIMMGGYKCADELVPLEDTFGV